LGGAAGGSQVLAASADRAEESRGEGYLHGLCGWAEGISGSDRSHLPSDRGAALHRASGAGFAEVCALEAPQGSGGRFTADLSCGHGGGSPAESGGGNSEMERLSQRQPSVAAELGSHHAFFPLSCRDSQGDLYHQQRGGTASLVAQDHQNPGRVSQRGVSAETAVSGDPAGVQKVDHASAKLEPSLKLLHRAVARTNAQTRSVGIMASQFFSAWMQRKGNYPPSLATQRQQQNQNQQQSRGRLHREIDSSFSWDAFPSGIVPTALEARL